MFKKIKIALAMVATLGIATAALAVPVTVTYTADNVVNAWWFQKTPGSFAFQNPAYAPVVLATGSNYNNWQRVDTAVLDFKKGDYSLIWKASNTGTGSQSNPAAFLGQLKFNSPWQDDIYTSVNWLVSAANPPLDVPEPYHNPGGGQLLTGNFDYFGWHWVHATEYGNNGGPNIWTNVNGGAVSGIDSQAEWIWTINNNNPNLDTPVYVRVDFSIVTPEPSTMILLGTGLVGLGLYCRRKKTIVG